MPFRKDNEVFSVLKLKILLKLKICDQLSMLVKVYNNKNEYCSEIKIPDATKVYLVVNISLEVKFTVEQNDETAIVLTARKN